MLNTYFKSIVMIIIIALSILSCDNSSRNKFNDISIFNKFEYQGNLDAKNVLVYLQGGPATNLTHNEFPVEFVRSAPSEALNNSLVVYVHQYQTLHPEFVNGQEISFEQAKKYDIESSKILNDVVNFFSGRNQKVFLIGTSFGAFVAQDYLAMYGSSLIDGAVICVGRLDAQDVFWQAFSEGREFYFKDGITPVEAKETDRKMIGDNDFEKINIPKLAAGLGYKRYTQLLKDVDLSKTIYIYGVKDEDVGCLSDDELKFLKTKNVRILKSEGGHQEACSEFLGRGVMNMVSN